MRKLVETATEILSGKIDEAKKPLHPNQQKLDVHEPEKNELTAKDFEMLRKGKKVTKEQKENNVKDLTDDDMEDDDEDDDEKESKLKEAAYSVKAARAGKDIGKPGKMFTKIAKSAGEKYGSEERGKKVAGAVLKKLRANEETNDYSFYVQSYLQEEGLESLSQISADELHVAMDIIEMAYQQQVESFDQLDEISVATMLRAKTAAKRKAAKAEDEGDEEEVMKRSAQASKFASAAKKKFDQNK